MIDSTCINVRSLIISQNQIDYKYSRIIEGLDVDYVYMSNKEIIRTLLKPFRGKRIILHIRYLKWYGYFLTIPIYSTIILLTLFRDVEITWSCHNIWEHKFKSRTINTFLRKLLFSVSKNVIVFHSDLKKFFPDETKIVVANFGNFKPYFKRLSSRNPIFNSKLKAWKTKNNITKIDTIYISATNKNIDVYIEMFRKLKTINSVFVIPQYFKVIEESNFLLFNEFIHAEVHQLLSTNEIIGIITHSNFSIPTSLYMFASYKIPIISYNVIPISTIIKDYAIGENFSNNEDLSSSITKLKSNYSYYQENTVRFLHENSWEKATAVHKEVWT